MNYKLLVVIGFIGLASCSGPEILPDAYLEVNDYEDIIPSDLAKGANIGRIIISSNQNDLVYELSSVSPAGAIIIDPRTGYIKVDNADLLKFENNESITALISVSNSIVSQEASITLYIDQLNSFDYEVIEYFQEIALGFEFGGASEITRRWEGNVRIYVKGSRPDYLMTELELIINELNELITTDIVVELVDNEPESNYVIFFGGHESYASIYPSSANLVNNNWGLFSIFWNGVQELNGGHMYVDIIRANTVEQRHLLREELTQSLGLGKDSEKYSTSIFQSSWTHTVEYDPIDKELVRLLYHPDLEIGLGRTQVAQILRNVLISEK